MFNNTWKKEQHVTNVEHIFWFEENVSGVKGQNS